jgi:integrase/recombinase XerD
MGRIDNAEISTILKTWQTLENGEHPVVTKVYSNNKKKLFTTGLTCSVGRWDEKAGRFKKNNAGNTKIIEIEIKARRIADNMIVNKGVFDIEQFSREFRKKADRASFFKFAASHIEKLRKHDRDGTADSYRDAVAKLATYSVRDINISDMTLKTFTDFMDWMTEKKQSINGIGIYMRSICAIYGAAITEGLVPSGTDARIGLVIKREDTFKRALSRENIDLIVNARFENARQEDSRRIFVFSYFCAGINFKDLCSLRWDKDIYDGRVHYQRNKTGVKLSSNINEYMAEILRWYDENRNPLGYVFNVYIDKDKHKTAQQKKHRRNSRAKSLNADLRKIAVELGIVKLTDEETKIFKDYFLYRKQVPEKLEHINFYAARHTFATVLKNEGVDTSIISEALGHSSEKVTQTYLASFSNTVLDTAQKKLNPKK